MLVNPNHVFKVKWNLSCVTLLIDIKIHGVGDTFSIKGVLGTEVSYPCAEAGAVGSAEDRQVHPSYPTSLPPTAAGALGRERWG